MITTAVELRDLLGEVTTATKLLQRSKTVPERVIGLIDSFESTLGAATPARLEGDPYLTSALWAAAFRAQKALRHDNPQEQRRDRSATGGVEHAGAVAHRSGEDVLHQQQAAQRMVGRRSRRIAAAAGFEAEHAAGTCL